MKENRGLLLRAGALAGLLASAGLAGCESDGEPPPTPLDSCEFARDGVCDEPVNCPLGSDETDCVAACALGIDLHLFAAACAHRLPPAPAPTASAGSGGALHLTGYRDAKREAPDGEALDETVERHYRIFVPRAYDPGRPTPLVIALPGHRVPHYNLPQYTQLARTADENGFILVDVEQQWRWNGEMRWAWWTDWGWMDHADENPDLALIVDLIDAVSGDYNIDPRRVYLTGHSRGGAMAFIGAIELSDLIAGACVQSGFSEYSYLSIRLSEWEGRKVPLYFMHGVSDPDVPVAMADAVVERLRELGWVDEEDLVYRRLDEVTHRWQPWLNQSWWEFLAARPLPEEP